MDFEKLELSTETLRELSDDELGRVAGGAQPGPLQESLICPTRGDTFSPCQPLITTNCS